MGGSSSLLPIYQILFIMTGLGDIIILIVVFRLIFGLLGASLCSCFVRQLWGHIHTVLRLCVVDGLELHLFPNLWEDRCIHRVLLCKSMDTSIPIAIIIWFRLNEWVELAKLVANDSESVGCKAQLIYYLAILHDYYSYTTDRTPFSVRSFEVYCCKV